MNQMYQELSKSVCKIFLPILAVLFLPFRTFAAPNAFYDCGSTPQNFRCIIGVFLYGIKIAIPVLASLTLLVFFWGLAKFILASGSEDKIEEGKNLMFWGLIALFVMMSVWGIVLFVSSSFGLDSGGFGIPLLPE